MTEINDRKPAGLPDLIRHYIDGAFVDACLYSLLRREWEAPDHPA